MTDPIRALCAELVEKLDDLSCTYNIPSQSALVTRASAILAAQPTPPADGEVAELVAELQGLADYFRGECYSTDWVNQITRAAELLAQRHPTPVAVSERLPCAEDCDAEGRCWFHSVGRKWCDWYLLKASCATETETHWLPAHALPLPAGEVK